MFMCMCVFDIYVHVCVLLSGCSNLKQQRNDRRETNEIAGIIVVQRWNILGNEKKTYFQRRHHKNSSVLMQGVSIDPAATGSKTINLLIINADAKSSKRYRRSWLAAKLLVGMRFT